MRVVKQGLALYGKGVDTFFMQNRLANASFINVLPELSFFDNMEQFGHKLKIQIDRKGCDIIHVHNEPDWMTIIAKQLFPDIPIVHDCHDLDSARVGRANEEQVAALDAADGVVFPSKGYARHYDDFYGADNKPKEVIYSMCNENYLHTLMLPRLRGIVYEGGASINPEESTGGRFSYRDYRLVARHLAEHNIPFTMFGLREDIAEEYGKQGVVCNPPTPYTTMMQQLTRYDWGLCGSPMKCNQWDWAMPNKLFEYTMAGVPSIVFNADETADFVREHGLGVVLEKWEQIPEIYDQHETYRKIVQEKRHLFTMENQVGKILGLYKKLI